MKNILTLKKYGTFALLLLFNTLYAQQDQATRFFAKNPENVYPGSIFVINSLNESRHIHIDAANDSIVVSSGLRDMKIQKLATNHSSYSKYLEEVLPNVNLQGISTAEFVASITDFKGYNWVNIYYGQDIDPDARMLKRTHMDKQTNLLVHLQHLITDLTMDIPRKGHLQLDLGKIGDYQQEDLAYVNSIYYGRKAVMIVRSNLPRSKVIDAIDALVKSDGVASKEIEEILSYCDVEILSSNNSTTFTESENPLGDVIKYFVQPFGPEDFLKPVSFEAINVSTRSPIVNKFN